MIMSFPKQIELDYLKYKKAQLLLLTAFPTYQLLHLEKSKPFHHQTQIKISTMIHFTQLYFNQMDRNLPNNIIQSIFLNP